MCKQFEKWMPFILKFKEDFNAAYDLALSAGLGDLEKKFIIFQPGDWPCQFFCRQIIFQNARFAKAML